MLLNTNNLTGSKLLATDGELGDIHDFYFDDQTWKIRYLVADTGNWLPGRLVLLAPQSFGSYFEEREEFCIHLLRQQIEDSPSSELHKPVSKHFEDQYFRHYGWSTQALGDGAIAMGAYPILLPPSDEEVRSWAANNAHEDPHLRSTSHLTGYQIQALDGESGNVCGFLVDNREWIIHEILVECGHWFSAKEVRISTGQIKRICYEESKIYVNLTKQEIERTAEHQIARRAEQHSKVGAV